MVEFSPEVLLLLAALGAVAVLAFLGTLANLVRTATAVHDLSVAAAALRINYDRQMAESRDEEVIEVDEAPPVEAVELPPVPGS